ncbi:MAG: hypothetical protein JXP73_17000 [Deltaproteobacteria bacterium]|nr:hypothetical protein [Deltaproteobacteria bacterium]
MSRSLAKGGRRMYLHKASRPGSSLAATRVAGTDGVDERRAADELDDRDHLEGDDDADEVDNEPSRAARPRR